MTTIFPCDFIVSFYLFGVFFTWQDSLEWKEICYQLKNEQQKVSQRNTFDLTVRKNEFLLQPLFRLFEINRNSLFSYQTSNERFSWRRKCSMDFSMINNLTAEKSLRRVKWKAEVLFANHWISEIEKFEREFCSMKEEDRIVLSVNHWSDHFTPFPLNW